MKSIVNCIVRLYLVHTYINRRFGNYMQASLIAKVCLSHVVQRYRHSMNILSKKKISKNT